MTNRKRKRFIAGATCPKCKAMDTIMLYFENNIEKIRCVQCDYNESQTDSSVQKAAKQSGQVIGVFNPD